MLESVTGKKVVLKEKKETVYMAVQTNSGRWEEQPQTYLGEIEWSEAVKIAKKQKGATRLSNSPGFRNQGHYFVPE